MKYLLQTLYICTLLFVAQSAYAGAISMPPNNLGLVGYWSFEDISGTGATTTDFSGNGNDGLLIADANEGEGKLGKGFVGDGAGDYVDVGSDSSVNGITGNITVSAWVKLDSVGNHVIVGNARDCCGTYNGFQLESSSAYGSKYSFRVWNGSVTRASSNSSSVAGFWKHIVGVYDGSNIIIYIDGVQDGSTAYSGGIGAPASASLKIGRMGTNATWYLDGNIDEVRIYNRALSATEVANLYGSGAARFNTSPRDQLTENLEGYWTFDGRDGLNDISGNDNHGTSGGSLGYVMGTLGQGIRSASGSAADIFSVSDPDELDVGAGEDFFISAWVRVADESVDTSPFRKKSSRSSPSDAGWSFYSLSPTNAVFLISDGVNRAFWSGIEALSSGDWQHLVMGINRSTGLGSVYVNGIKDQELAGNDDGLAAVGDLSNATSFTISGDNQAVEVDDFRFYKTAPTQELARQLYNMGQSLVNKTVENKTAKDSLVAHWSFDGPSVSGSTITDVSGNGNDATESGTDVPGLGKVGQGYDFTGAGNDGITFTDISFSGEATIAAWVNPDDLSSDGAFRTVIGNNVGDRIFISSTGQLNIRQSATNLALSPTGVVSIGEWTHVVVTWDGSTATGYINGVATSPTRSVASITNYNAISIISSTGEWDGRMDDIRIYNKALSAAEVLQLYNETR